MLKIFMALTFMFVHLNASGFGSQEQINLLFFGAFGMMVIYNLGYYIITKEITYADYFLFHGFVFAIMLFYAGMFDSASLEFTINSVPVGFFLFASAALLAFSKHFLELESIDKRMVTGINYLIYINLAFFALSAFTLVNGFLIDIAIIFVIFTAFVLLALSLYLSLVKKEVYARFYLVGFSALFITIAVSLLSHFNLLESSSQTLYYLEFSILFEASVFSFAITHQHRESMLKLSLNKLMYKELSHRIQNNLQSIMSILRIQKRRVDENEIKEYLEETIRRIHVMSQIHKKLQDTKLTGKVDMYPFLSDLLKLYKDLNENVDFTLNCEKEIYLDIDRLIPLALMINELITNSIKHAFANTDTPKIIISIEEQEMYQFRYEDNGSGFEDAADSIGSLLIDIFAHNQLKGKSTLDTKDRYFFSLSFPKV